MLGLFLTYVLIFAALTALLWAGTLFFQGYIYSEPASQLYWRAPLASLILTLFWAFWCSLDYRSIQAEPEREQGRYRALFEFDADDSVQFDKFWSVKNGKEILYKKQRNAQGRVGYYHQGKPWSRSDAEGIVEAVIVEDKDGQKSRFEAELTKDRKFKTGQGQAVRYVEVDGRHRVMTDADIGRIASTRYSLVFANIGLNLLHLVVWFLCLWLIMRFQWGHALGFALVIWLALTVVIMPMIFRKTEDVARQRAAESRSVAVSAGRS